MLFLWFDLAHTVTTSTEAVVIPRVIGATVLHATVREIGGKAEDMAIQNNPFSVRLAFVAALALTAAFLPADVSAESTKTVELDIRPGGTVYTFTEAIVRNFYSVFPLFQRLHCVLSNPMDTKHSQTRDFLQNPPLYRFLELRIYPAWFLQKSWLVLINCIICTKI